jgi:hypothetical protein
MEATVQSSIPKGRRVHYSRLCQELVSKIGILPVKNFPAKVWPRAQQPPHNWAQLRLSALGYKRFKVLFDTFRLFPSLKGFPFPLNYSQHSPTHPPPLTSA